MIDKTTLEGIVKRFNEITECDPTAAYDLRRVSVACNQVLAEHPTVPVGYPCQNAERDGIGYHVRFIGILNGLLFEEGDERRIAEMYADEDDPEYPKFLGYTILGKEN